MPSVCANPHLDFLPRPLVVSYVHSNSSPFAPADFWKGDPCCDAPERH